MAVSGAPVSSGGLRFIVHPSRLSLPIWAVGRHVGTMTFTLLATFPVDLLLYWSFVITT